MALTVDPDVALQYPLAFSPFTLKNVELRNRMIRTSMGSGLPVGGLVSDDLVAITTTDRRAGIPAAVCGELAGDPNTTGLLIGRGIRELSMSAPAIPTVKDAVRRTTLADATALAADALSRSTATEVRALLAI